MFKNWNSNFLTFIFFLENECLLSAKMFCCFSFALFRCTSLYFESLGREEEVGKCWMDEPRIWGETECVIQIDNVIYTDTSNFTPGISFWIILTTISILFVGLFTSIEPLITRQKRTWAEALRQNWQVFALIFAIFFLWRLNELMSNL